MADTIKLKRSSTAGEVPTTAQLAVGEPAFNAADGKLFIKRDDTVIVEIGSPENMPDNAIQTSKYQDLSVTGAKIADGTITSAKIGTGEITSTNILDGTIQSTDIQTGAVTADKLGALSVTTAKLALSAVTSVNILDGTIATADLSDSSVTQNKLANNSVGTNQLIDANVTTAKIADSAVTTAKLNALAVTTAKIAANAVTSAKVDSTVATQTGGTGAIKTPSGVTGNRPASPAAGYLRHNTSLNLIEFYDGTAWAAAGDGGNADLLDGVDSLQFLRSDEADTKTSGDLSFSNNVKADFEQIKIHSDGTNGFMDLSADMFVRNGTTTRFKFTTNGDFHADGDLVSFSTSVGSDERIKQNIEVIEDPINKVQQLRGVEFEWKKNGKADAGLIAQDVQNVMPQLVNEFALGDDEHLVLNYNGVIGLLVEAIKDQQKQIDELKEKLK